MQNSVHKSKKKIIIMMKDGINKKNPCRFISSYLNQTDGGGVSGARSEDLISNLHTRLKRDSEVTCGAEFDGKRGVSLTLDVRCVFFDPIFFGGDLELPNESEDL